MGQRTSYAPGGGIAIVRDPQAAVFALFEGRVDP